LQARVAQGAWFLRIEDLDLPRVVPGAADAIIATLAAFGFEWQGAIEYQSERLERYADAIARLSVSELIYVCSCSRAEIVASRPPSDAGFETEETRYPGNCRLRQLSRSESTALRFNVPVASITFADRLQGTYTQDVAGAVGDFVLHRRDGIYAYHLAVVVDDAAQGVTEVVRGADLLASTPRHILLQQALCVPTPAYAHLPLALDSAGRKLSKSSQSLPIDARKAGFLLWHALAMLRQSPPEGLLNAPTSEIWNWAIGNWSLAPISGLATCQAPTPVR
jgi:glutamyl-Q tRNA(Asp) synthetase